MRFRFSKTITVKFLHCVISSHVFQLRFKGSIRNLLELLKFNSGLCLTTTGAASILEVLQDRFCTMPPQISDLSQVNNDKNIFVFLNLVRIFGLILLYQRLSISKRSFLRSNLAELHSPPLLVQGVLQARSLASKAVQKS
jgi:hypothetical protein